MRGKSTATDRMINGPTIDYDALAQDAMRGVVRTILTSVAKNGLPGDHHFYISFDTQAAGVSVSRRLRERYPEEMTIVLQHRFWDLSVADERFEVKLTFDGIPEKLVVPFTALKVFFDPSVRYALQFEEPGSGPDGVHGGDLPDQAARALVVSMQQETTRPGGRPAPRLQDRKPRQPRKPRIERPADGTGAPSSTAPGTPAEVPKTRPAAGRAGEQPRADAAPPAGSKDDKPVATEPAGTKPAVAEGASKDAGGAQIVRLDAFRKK